MKYWLKLLILLVISIFCFNKIPRTDSDEIIEYDHEQQFDSHYWKGVCTSGREQSPINMTLYQLMLNNSLKFYNERISYNDFTFDATIYANPNYIKINGPSDSKKVAFSITYNDSSTYDYKLDNIHFHSPSEHTIRSQKSNSQGYYDAEVHFVHTLLNGNLKRNKIVFGIFFYIGSSNDPWIDSLKLVDNHLLLVCNGTLNKACKDEYDPDEDHSYEYVVIPGLKSPRDILLRANGTLYKYAGGLTTPTCDEIVNWYVFDSPLQITQATLNVLKYNTIRPDIDKVPEYNNRLIQQINNRIIYVENSLIVMSKTPQYYMNAYSLFVFVILFLL